MKLELVIVPLAILVLSAFIWMAKSDQIVPLQAELELTHETALDTLKTGKYYLFDAEAVTDGLVRQELTWSVQDEGAEFPQFFSTIKTNIFKNQFGNPGTKFIRAYQNSKLVAVDTFVVVNGFNSMSVSVKSLYQVDTLAYFINETKDTKEVHWEIYQMGDEKRLVFDELLYEQDTLSVSFDSIGDYLAYVEVSNDQKEVLMDSVEFSVFNPNTDEDIDSDGDGRFDYEDAFPDDVNEWEDLDGDGHGDNKDDRFPEDPTEWYDQDRDGIGNNEDPDIDGDGVKNADDYYPYNRSKWEKEVKEPTGGGTEEPEEDENTAACFGDRVIGMEKTSTGLNAPPRSNVVFEEGRTEIKITPYKDVALESFNYWSNPAIGLGSQNCELQIRCLTCSSNLNTVKFSFSTPQDNKSTVEYSLPRQDVLLAGHEYILILRTKKNTKIGFVPVTPEDNSNIENILKIEYLTPKSCVFDLIFKN